MHRDDVGIVFDARKGALDVVVSRVAIVSGVGDGKVPLPFAEVVEGVGEVEGRFVALVGPIIDSECARPWSEATVGQGARFATRVEHVD